MRDKSSSLTSFRESLTFLIHETRYIILCCFHSDLIVCAYLEAMVTKKDRRKAAACYYLIASQKKRSHQFWVRDWIKQREKHNIMNNLLEKLELED